MNARPENPWPQASGFHFQFSRYEWLRPVLKPKFWGKANPWFGATTANLWFAFRFPRLPYPFLSWKIELPGGEWKGYFGWKVYGLGHPEYSTWLPEKYQPPELVNGRHVRFACVLSFRWDADS